MGDILDETVVTDSDNTADIDIITSMKESNCIDDDGDDLSISETATTN